VPGDLVKLSLGAVVAADVKLTGGEVLLDQSMLTGESVPIEAGAGLQTYAGALVRRGEAEAEVTATGARTKFGRTAELVRTAHVVSTQQKAVLRVVRNLAAFNGVIIVLLVGYSWYLKMPVGDIIPLVLTAILASIPVALPATFTLASALGARALAKLGVLPTRLSAVDEAASMVVLCADKTGTLTQNALTVTTVHPMPGFDEAHVLALAALASSDGGDDPVDGAIRAAAASKAVSDAPKLTKFAAFDPAKKMSEATATDVAGSPQRIVKGAYVVVIGLAQPSPTAAAAAKELEDKGFRVLAVAAGPATGMKLAGLVALSDPPRKDSAALISELHGLGVRTVMVTGDAPTTAAIVAKTVGLDGAICPPGPIPDAVHPEQFAVFAGVLPEDKYKLVKAFQKGGHTVGMCGDGANDAPALRQAQMGIAVSTATDVAKSAAGMVLTEPGLARHRRRGQGRAYDVPAHPELYAELDHQENRAGAVSGDWPAHDRPCDPDPAADGLDHDHRRLPRHVVDDRQCPAVGCAERLADRQSDARRRHHGHRRVAVLHGHPRCRRLPDGVHDKHPADPGLRRHCVRQSGDDLYQSRAPPPVVVPPKHLAPRLVRRRSPDRLDPGRGRHCDDASAGVGRGGHAGCGRCLRDPPGFGEGARIPTPQDHLGPRNAMWLLRLQASGKVASTHQRGTNQPSIIAGVGSPHTPTDMIGISA
jgi:soluble P-type ATPase